MGVRLFIDDIRDAPPGWTVVRNSRTAHIMIDGLRQQGIKIDAISFDHDIPCNGVHETSRSIMLYLAEHDYWPESVYVHSMNPVGRSWLEETVQHYAPPGTLKRW